MGSKIILRAFGAAACLLGSSLAAQSDETPYWASISVDKVFMRVGPSAAYPIEWVYQRRGLPVKVLRTNEGWRYVEDPDGKRGWMAARMLSRTRGAIVTGEQNTAIRSDGGAQAPLRWHVEPGVVGALGACENGWCEFSVGQHRGFVDAEHLWGDGDP